MERPSWINEDTGKSRWLTFCPTSVAVEKRRKFRSKQTPGVSSVSPTFAVTEKSALDHQYDMELHQMIAYMRRLDGKLPPNSRGQKVMDPFAPDGASKWCTSGSKTPLFGFWAYYAWDNVFSELFSSAFGRIFKVTNQMELRQLLDAKVMM
jgi:hypothetical protein